MVQTVIWPLSPIIDNASEEGESLVEGGRLDLFMGNNNREDMTRVGSYQLKLCRRRTMVLHIVLYASDVQYNLSSVVVLLCRGLLLALMSTR